MLSLLAIPGWAWAVSAIILVIAVALIVLIIVFDIVKKDKNNGGEGTADKSAFNLNAEHLKHQITESQEENQTERPSK